jgi:serine/threonine-protein kinase
MRGPSYTGRILGGRYEVRELLGEGGWGSVYAAVQADLGRRVALKILHVDVAVNAEAVSRFEREAKAAAALGHPNIVQVTDFRPGAGGEPPFLVMEILTGATLGGLLRVQRTLPPARVATIAFQMLSALDVAHRAGIVHRDVKPDNVFLVSMPGIQDLVKLLDFGIAKLSVDDVAQLTSGAQLLGSPAFMSPEQVRSLPVDPRADLYAVGATMYFALAGRLPFEATSVAALLSAIVAEPPAPLALAAQGLDPRLTALVHRALEKEPGRRFSSAAEMRAALEPWAGGVTSAPAGAPPPPRAGVTASAPSPVSPLGYTAASPSPPTGPSPRPTPTGAPIFAPPTARAPKGQSAIVVVLAIVVGLLLLGGVVAVVAIAYRERAGAPPPTPSSASVVAPSPVPAPSSSAALAADSASAAPTPKSGATRVAPEPRPTPPVIDAGGALVDAGRPNVVVVDAGARRQWAGSTVRISMTVFEAYDPAAGRKELDRVLPSLQPCFAATEYEPPDHQFTYWNVAIDPTGRVTKVARVTEADPHPRLDACVVTVLRATRWQATPRGGAVRVGLTARTRDNP